MSRIHIRLIYLLMIKILRLVVINFILYFIIIYTIFNIKILLFIINKVFFDIP